MQVYENNFYSSRQSRGEFLQTFLSSVARYEAMFGDALTHELGVPPQIVRLYMDTPSHVLNNETGIDVYKDAQDNAKSFMEMDHNIEVNSEYANVWRTTPMVQIEGGRATNDARLARYFPDLDQMKIPEPIFAIFKEDLRLIGTSILVAPAQKFTFNPPQLHTMLDLPAEEWYSFDWIGMIDGIIGELDKTCPFVEALEKAKDSLVEILPDTPSPKNIEEAFFWNELRATGRTPYEYFLMADHWWEGAMYAEIYASLGVDYYEAIRSGNVDMLYEIMHQPQNSAIFADQEESFKAIVELGLGAHWTAKDADLSGLSQGYQDLVAKIRSDPDYDKAFDQSISYDEREAVRIELDKKMRAMIDANWQKFLEAFKNSILMQNPLKSLLQVV